MIVYQMTSKLIPIHEREKNKMQKIYQIGVRYQKELLKYAHVNKEEMKKKQYQTTKEQSKRKNNS